MKLRRRHGRSIGCGAMVALIGCLAAWAQQPLDTLEFNIVGIELRAEPAALTVPKNTPTLVFSRLALPPGAGAAAGRRSIGSPFSLFNRWGRCGGWISVVAAQPRTACTDWS